MANENIFGNTDFMSAVESALEGTPQTPNEPVTPPANEPPVTPPADIVPPVTPPAPQTSPVTEPAATEPKTVEIIKEVEKIIEKLPEFKNDESKLLYEAWLSGDDGKKAVRDYIRETEKDYTTMSDMEVRREAIKKEHPNWSKADVDLEIRHKYGKNLEKIDVTDIDRDLEPDEYNKAVAHNEEVEKNLETLAVHARDDRYSLIDAQSKIELPKIKQAETTVATGPSEEEIQVARDKWSNSVNTEMPKLLAEKMTIDDKEVAYDYSDAEKTELTSYMQEFNLLNLARDMGWQKEDGTPDILKIAKDVHLLKNKEGFVKAIAAQVKTGTTKQVLASIKNIDDKAPALQGQQAFSSFEEAAYDALDRAKSNKRSA